MIMSRSVAIFVNGILTFPGNTRDWNYRAVVWTQVKKDGHAQAVEYFCGPIGRAFGQRKRAAKIGELLLAYQGWDITLVGHSNGCDVILTALNSALIYPTIKAVHFVSAACQADFNRNGLNDALENGNIGKVCVYRGGKDWALKVASGIVGRCLGYGVLGLTGALSVAPAVSDRVGEILWPEFGHGDCFQPEHFEQTMKHFFSP